MKRYCGYHISDLFDIAERLFDDFDFGHDSEAVYSYPDSFRFIKIDETKSQFKGDLPGLGKDDIKIEFVPGKRELTLSSAKEGYKFLKRWRFPQHAKITTASMKHGVLTIDIEKDLPPEYQPETIEVQ